VVSAFVRWIYFVVRVIHFLRSTSTQCIKFGKRKTLSGFVEVPTTAYYGAQTMAGGGELSDFRHAIPTLC